MEEGVLEKRLGAMESTVEELTEAYDALVEATTGVLEARESFAGPRRAAEAGALENLRRQWERFKASCDRAEEAVESARRRIGLEGVAAAAVAGPRMAHALHTAHSLAAELRHGSGGAASLASPPAAAAAPPDAVPSEDKEQ